MHCVPTGLRPCKRKGNFKVSKPPSQWFEDFSFVNLKPFNNDPMTNIVGQSGPLRTNTNRVFSQSELEAKTCNNHQARENVQPVKKAGNRVTGDKFCSSMNN